jgi:glycosyltransferase involved in cell wall biosynthesis
VRILHLVHAYFPAMGGTERLVRRLSEELVHTYGDRVTVMTLNTTSIEAFTGKAQGRLPVGSSWLDGVEVRRYPFTTWLARPLYFAQGVAYVLRLPGNDWLRAFYTGPISRPLSRAASTEPCDVIAASSFPLLHMHSALRAGQRQRRPVVLFGGLHPHDQWGFDRANIYRAIARADHYVAYTPFERDYVIARGVPPEQISVIGLATDVDAFTRADSHAVRQRFGIGDSPLVAFIGQQASHKGIDTLLRAMPRVWKEIPTARLLLAGSRTRYSARLDQLLAALGSDRARVTVVPNFAEEEKPALFAACDIFAYPSHYESFGIAILEAWAAHKPVIGCGPGAVAAVIDDGYDGLLTTFNDHEGLAAALLRLLRDPALRQSMGERGHAKVRERHTWPQVTANIRAVYEHVIAARAAHDTRHGVAGRAVPPAG